MENNQRTSASELQPLSDAFEVIYESAVIGPRRSPLIPLSS